MRELRRGELFGRPRAAESSGHARPAPCRRSAACRIAGSTRTSAHAARPSSRPGRASWQSGDRCPIPASPSPRARRPIGGRRAARSRQSRRAPAGCRPSRRCRPRSACATSSCRSSPARASSVIARVASASWIDTSITAPGSRRPCTACMPAQAAAIPPIKADCSPTARIGASSRSSTWPVSMRAMPLAKNSVRSVAGSSACGPVWPNGEISTSAAFGLIRRSVPGSHSWSRSARGPPSQTIRSARRQRVASDRRACRRSNAWQAVSNCRHRRRSPRPRHRRTAGRTRRRPARGRAAPPEAPKAAPSPVRPLRPAMARGATASFRHALPRRSRTSACASHGRRYWP